MHYLKILLILIELAKSYIILSKLFSLNKVIASNALYNNTQNYNFKYNLEYKQHSVLNETYH
jgi:hypothetical protein